MTKTGAKFSPNGGKILDGTGLAAVRKRIEEAFSHVPPSVRLLGIPRKGNKKGGGKTWPASPPFEVDFQRRQVYSVGGADSVTQSANRLFRYFVLL